MRTNSIFAPEHFENTLGCVRQDYALVFPPWHPDGGKMAYQARGDKHRTTAREFRVVNVTAAHDFVFEVPGEARLFVLLPPSDCCGANNIAVAYRDVGTTDLRDEHLLRYSQSHGFDETFGVNMGLNAEVFFAPPHAVAIGVESVRGETDW